MKLLALVVVIGCSGSSTTPSKPPPNAADRDSCKAAEDCMLVDACCGCNAVGRRVAIRKDFLAAYEGTRAQRCADNKCKPGISVHSSCDAEAICDHDRCKVQPHMGGLP